MGPITPHRNSRRKQRYVVWKMEYGAAITREWRYRPKWSSEAQTMVCLLRQDHWFVACRETTKSTSGMRLKHAENYREYDAKWKCQYFSCFNKRLETAHHGSTNRLWLRHLSDLIMGRTGEPEGSHATSQSGKETSQLPTGPDALRRDSAPSNLQSVRDLKQQINQPIAEDMERMLKAYSFDDDASGDEQPTSVLRTTEKKSLYAARESSLGPERGGPSSTEPAPGNLPRRQTSQDQLLNPRAVVISGDSSVGEVSDGGE